MNTERLRCSLDKCFAYKQSEVGEEWVYGKKQDKSVVEKRLAMRRVYGVIGKTKFGSFIKYVHAAERAGIDGSSMMEAQRLCERIK